MVHYKTKEEIEMMRESVLLVSRSLAEVAKMLKPGIATLQLDKTIGEFIKDHKGVPSFLNYRGYPYNSCISVNDTVVHGFPNGRALQNGDIVSVDIGVFKNGF